MNNRSFVFIIVVVVLAAVVGGVALYYVANESTEPVWDSVFTPSASSTPPPPTEIKVPLDLYDETLGIDSSLQSEHVSHSTGDVVELVYEPGGYRTECFNLLVNQEKLKNICGMRIKVIGFSPGEQSFALQAIQTSAVFEFSVYVVQLRGASSTVSVIGPRVKNSQPEVSPGFAHAYISDASWDGAETLRIFSHYLFSEIGGPYTKQGFYRVSPKELWEYDLETGEYTFIKELPEE